ncbi:hypothetical protein Entcl_4312 [[Enterobacter] lignolyticus SCF1]|uniref:Uncharacterized protein n=1 Tax=Enterobacter lignolyticus (strain SCF1) TaxID=701347 RepID=E3G4S5_ENTLS|nr:hypothetical protein Entcl_4312 [[Enterobacter] lignolyticus SCF1]
MCVSELVVVENNSLSKLALEGCAIAAPCRTKVAEQLLEIGVKAGITGIVAKEIADKISADELDHLITLKMMGNDDITSKYLGLLEGKYGPSNTGGEQIADSGPTDTGGNQTATGNTPSHTGNNKPSGQGSTNTGNTEGLPNTGGNTTVTPITEGPNKDDFIYMSDGHMLGANGVKVPSKTIWKGEGKERIDVENPNPGQRPGQVHYQDNKNNKYYYNPNSNDFYSFDASKNKIPAPSSVNKLLEDPKFKQAIDKGMKQYLGEK